MGASGSGKTTFFRILLGLDKPDSGTVAGTEGAFLSAVFQENRLCESFSSLDNVLMVFPKVTRKYGKPQRKIYVNFFQRSPSTGLSLHLKRRHETRVAVCRALAVPLMPSLWMNRLPVWMRTRAERSSRL